MFDLAVVLEREKQFNRALAMYRRVLHQQPNNTRAWANIGRLLLIQNRYGDAQKAFAKVKTLEKNDPAASFNIGIINLEQKLPDDAIKEFRALLTNAPLPGAGSLLYRPGPRRKGGYQGGHPGVPVGGSRTPNNSFRPASGWPTCSISKGKRTGPGRSWKKSGRLAPDREEIYLTTSYFYEEESLWDRAIGVLKEGMDKVERPGEIYFRLAVIYEKKQDRDESIAISKRSWSWIRTTPTPRIFWVTLTPSRGSTWMRPSG